MESRSLRVTGEEWGMSKFIGEVEARRFLKQGLLLGASALAIGLAAPAFAQTTPAGDQAAPADAPKDDKTPPKLPKKDEPDAPDIIVSGLRASIASAQSIKMNSGQFVDS